MWFDVGQPCLRRRAADGTSRGGSSPTCMFKMSSWLTCWWVSTAFSLRRRAPTNVSVEKKKSPSFATLASTFGNSTFPKARAETRPSFVMSRRVSDASPSLGITLPTHATPSGAPGQGFVAPGGTDAQPLFQSCVRFLLAAFFFYQGCKQRANYAVSLRSADLVLLN